MFRAINMFALIDVHRLDSQSVDYRLIVHGLIVTFMLANPDVDDSLQTGNRAGGLR